MAWPFEAIIFTTIRHRLQPDTLWTIIIPPKARTGTKIEPLLPPGSGDQGNFTLKQRRGHIQLLSLMDTARHELHRYEG